MAAAQESGTDYQAREEAGMVWLRCGACKTTNSLGSGIKPLGYREEKSLSREVTDVALHVVSPLQDIRIKSGPAAHF